MGRNNNIESATKKGTKKKKAFQTRICREWRQSFFCAELGAGVDLLASDASFSLIVGFDTQCGGEREKKKKLSLAKHEKKKSTKR